MSHDPLHPLQSEDSSPSQALLPSAGPMGKHSAEMEELNDAVKRGPVGLYCMAGLSLLNMVLDLFNATIRFSLGLISASILHIFAHQSGTAIAVLVDIVLLAAMVGLGVFSGRGRTWASILGIVWVLLDMVVLVWIYTRISFSAESARQLLLGVFVHGLALIGLVAGVVANVKLNKLNKLKKEAAVRGNSPWAAESP